MDATKQEVTQEQSEEDGEAFVADVEEAKTNEEEQLLPEQVKTTVIVTFPSVVHGATLIFAWGFFVNMLYSLSVVYSDC